MRWMLLVVLLPAAAARADLQPGNWEVTATTSVEGVPQPISLKETRCLSAEDARDPSRVFGAQGALCEFSNRQDTGSAYSFELSCGGQPPIRGAGRVRYGGESFDGEIELRADVGGQQLVTRSRIAGRRLGDC